jgi:arsenate reductase-like glutaredoxin family protein
MSRVLAIILLAATLPLFSQDCDKYKKEIDVLMEEFNEVKEKMSQPGITRDEYDDLYSIYTMTWDDIVNLQKEQKKCIESQKKIITVKVEPKRVDEPLPKLHNIAWSSDRLNVRESLRNIAGMKIENSDGSVLQYKGGKFMSYDVEKWQFDFTNKKLYACQIILKTPKNTNPLKLYEKVSDDFKKKYSEPAYEKDKFPAGYKDDKIKLNAIKNKTVSIYRRWLFKNDDTVKIGFHDNGSVLITYLVEKHYKKAK